MASLKLTALELISSARLDPTEHHLLKHFVEGAVDPDRAARYLLSTVDKSTNQDVETCLRCFKKDWRDLVTTLTTFDPVPARLDELVRRRDGPSCAISSMDPHPPNKNPVLMSESAYIIPPSIFPNLDLAKEIYSDNDGDILRNLWLLSPSIHKAFRGGHVNVQARGLTSKSPEDELEGTDSAPEVSPICSAYIIPREPSDLFLGKGTYFQNSRQNFTCSTIKSEGLNPPSRFLFAIHYRFSAALHLFYIEDKIARGWPQHRLVGVGFLDNSLYRFGALARRIFYCTWLYVPKWARMRCYRLLVRAGRWLYGASSWQDVQRVPFGLVVKDCLRSYENEVSALRLVAQYTSIPAPRIVDTGEYRDKKYLVMSCLPGQMLGDVLHLMSYEERDRFADRLAECVEQIRPIPNSTPYLLCDTLGGPLSDHRIPDTSGGPFNTEEDFNDHLTSHMGCTAAAFFGGQTSYPQNHSICFTHSDFHRTNLLVDQGQLSGIIDWECAGYKPEYWEYTKALWTSLGDPILETLFHRAFAQLGNYDAELAAERKLWRYTPFGV
ncbi:hypothetical protein V498_07143 [Pseudogymnoascus sp. VKM F-4517 (FW-2822)]|nr:hypothetical protein V498_07143 [Pseudogymnoascus sp. VKM F-4517 (FW-2822)]